MSHQAQKIRDIYTKNLSDRELTKAIIVERALLRTSESLRKIGVPGETIVGGNTLSNMLSLLAICEDTRGIEITENMLQVIEDTLPMIREGLQRAKAARQEEKEAPKKI